MNSYPPYDCYLVYAFPHSSSEASLVDFAIANGGPWKHWISRLCADQEGMETVFDHSYSFMPHVRRLLFPEFDPRRAMEISATAGGLAAMDVGTVRRALTPQNQRMADYYHQTALRLTWQGNFLMPNGRINIRIPRDPARHDLLIRWIDAVLFPEGVGVLIVATTLPAALDAESAASLVRHLKKIQFRRRLTVEVAEIIDGTVPPAMQSTTSWAALLEELLATLPLGSPASAKITSAEITATLGVNWRMAIVGHPTDLKPGDFAAPFENVADRACFALATGHMSPLTGDQDVPTAEHWKNLVSSMVLAPWRDWRMLYHYDNLVQVVSSSDPSYVRHQHENFENEYLLLFVLATAQRHALDLMEIELTRVSGRAEVASGEVKEFISRLIRFNTRLWHQDAIATPVGAPLYSLLTRQFGLAQSLDTLRGDAAALESHLEARASRRRAIAAVRTQRLIEVLTIVLLPVGFLAALLQDQLKQLSIVETITPAGAIIVLLLAGLSVSLIWLIATRGTRRSEQNDL